MCYDIKMYVAQMFYVILRVRAPTHRSLLGRAIIPFAGNRRAVAWR